MISQKAKSSRFNPKKHLGQNFLINNHVVNKILVAADFKPTDIILEIGPGKGMLTKSISPRVKKIIAVETDDALARELEIYFQGTNTSVIHADFLEYPLDAISEGPLKVIGNLPYNIATPIIEKIIFNRRKMSGGFFTVQLEHGLRMSALPHSKNYGSLSCFVQYYAKVKRFFNIKNTCFYPAPKVQSCFLGMEFYREPKEKAVNEEFLFQLIRQAFAYRRKTMINSLSEHMDKAKVLHIFQELKFNPQWRAENLTLSQYILLANTLSH